jgi:hypothetical protein
MYNYPKIGKSNLNKLTQMKTKSIIKKLDTNLHKLIIFASFPIVLVGLISLCVCVMLDIVNPNNPFIRIYKKQMTQNEIDQYFSKLIVYLKHTTLIFYILLLTWYLYF